VVNGRQTKLAFLADEDVTGIDRALSAEAETML
jgi:hypothetical protein